MSSRCKRVMSVMSECPLGARGSLGCHADATQFTALVQDYLSENFSQEVLFYW